MVRSERASQTLRPYTRPILSRHGDATQQTQGIEGWGVENWLFYKKNCVCVEPVTNT